jgi:uncharacterized membrane protein YdfJ with MMPL/SSD domain
LALAVLVSLLVVVTFVPAALAILGHRLFWPSRAGAQTEPAVDEDPETTGWQSRAIALARAGRR